MEISREEREWASAAKEVSPLSASRRVMQCASCYEVTFVKVKIRHPTNFLPDDHICLHFQLLEGALI